MTNNIIDFKNIARKSYRDEMDYELSEAVKHINTAIDNYVTEEWERNLLLDAINKILRANNDVE